MVTSSSCTRDVEHAGVRSSRPRGQRRSTAAALTSSSPARGSSRPGGRPTQRMTPHRGGFSFTSTREPTSRPGWPRERGVAGCGDGGATGDGGSGCSPITDCTESERGPWLMLSMGPAFLFRLKGSEWNLLSLDSEAGGGALEGGEAWLESGGVSVSDLAGSSPTAGGNPETRTYCTDNRKNAADNESNFTSWFHEPGTWRLGSSASSGVSVWCFTPTPSQRLGTFSHQSQRVVPSLRWTACSSINGRIECPKWLFIFVTSSGNTDPRLGEILMFREPECRLGVWVECEKPVETCADPSSRLTCL